MTVLKPIELEVFLRQCLICFGHGRILYVGGNTVDALRFLLNAGVDAYALLHSEEEATRVASFFSRTRVATFKAGMALDNAFPATKFDALIVAEDNGPESEVTGQVLEASIGQVAVLTQWDSGDAIVLAADSCIGGLLAGDLRRHARSRTAVFQSPFPPACEFKSCFFETLPESAAITNAEPLDVLRGADSASVAALSGVTEMCEYVRIGDSVGVFDTSGGSAARVIEQNSAPRRVFAFVPDESALRYAKANYGSVGRVRFDVYAAAAAVDEYFDVLVTTDCTRVPVSLLQGLLERLRPGGRVIMSVPEYEPSVAPAGQSTARAWLRTIAGDAADRLIIEKAFRSNSVLAAENARTWRLAALDEPLQPEAGGLIVVAMVDPLTAPNVPYVETTFETLASDDFAVVPGAGDMANPWLFKSMISIGMRLTNNDALAELNDRVMASLPSESADFGAALCGQAYRVLGKGPSAAEAHACVEKIESYLGTTGSSPQQLRWSVSLAFVAAKLAQTIGELDRCEHWALRCASMDPMPFSPLLGTKIVGALDLAASLALVRGDCVTARERLVRAVRTVRHLLSGDWINILGNEDKPLSFGLPEVAQVAEAGARCAYLLNFLDDSQFRRGLVWWEHRGYYERILDAGMRRTESLEAYASTQLRNSMRLEDVIVEKNNECSRLEGVISEKEAERLRLEGLIEEKEADRLRLEGESASARAGLENLIAGTDAARVHFQGMATETDAMRVQFERAIAEKLEEIQRLEQAFAGKEVERLRLESVIAEKEGERLRCEGMIADKEAERLRLESMLAEKESERLRCEGVIADKEAERLRLEKALLEKEWQRATLDALLAADRATARAREAFQRAADEETAAAKAAGRGCRLRWNLKRLWNVLTRGLRRAVDPATSSPDSMPATRPVQPADLVVRQPVAPIRFDDLAGRWLAQIGGATHVPVQFSDAAVAVLGISAPAGASAGGLKLVTARELSALRRGEGEVVVALFGEHDDVYALRAHVYDKIDLCIAMDQQSYGRLALLHPLVVQATPAQAVDTAQRFCAAIAQERRLGVGRVFNEVVDAPVIMLQVDNFMVGGLERVVFDLLQHLADRGFRPMLGVTGEIAPEAEAELQERRFACVRLPQEPEALRAALADNQVALVNAHYSLSLVEACGALRIPFIQTVHNMYMWLDEPSKEQWRTADQTTDGYICVSANVAMFADVNLRLARERMLVIPNGVDAASRVPLSLPESDEALRAELGFPSDSPVFVNVASINPVKGQGLLIDAFARAHAQRPGIRLLILGKHADMGYAQLLREKIAGYGLQDAVLMPGYRADVHRFVDLARAVVMPSFTEGWSLAISEAVQRHAPVIATDVGGAHEQLVDPASTVIRAWRDEWASLDGQAFYHAIANEGEFHAVRDELTRVLVEHADRLPRSARSQLQKSFTSMTPAQAYERHVEVFTAVLAHRYATPVRYASYRPQRQSRHVDADQSGADAR
ncbi:glycosyltransferase [Paraburkholderia sacchari]|uniref:glycosyltransferase n=1 Tax=Paraburkholderia sacchari TaxID=159450 RepID=UPI003D988ADB